ncbi:hypothetical protein CHS0354_041776 [Potamilus streckersoni]|uniref:Fibrinogen C-terminal domain-containing protein n=1 Tax=Potamilus streckersoni TaxID=2493646 RepID=A0AAE0T2A9_9BIVA|nr:hypothetical protein CHS0354_041776 [Potamilus streckersoni]
MANQKLGCLFKIIFLYMFSLPVQGRSTSFFNTNKLLLDERQSSLFVSNPKYLRPERSLANESIETRIGRLEMSLEDEKNLRRNQEKKVNGLVSSLEELKKMTEKQSVNMQTMREDLHRQFSLLDKNRSPHVRRLEVWLGEIKSWFTDMSNEVKQVSKNSALIQEILGKLAESNVSISNVSMEILTLKHSFANLNYTILKKAENLKNEKSNCASGWGGEKCDVMLQDCSHISKFYNTGSGIYTIFLGYTKMSVFCNMDIDSAGWTVIQRRKDGSVNFANRTYLEYSNGFGNLSGEFWIGNDKLHQMTKEADYMLRIDLEKWDGSKWYALYNSFGVGSAEDGYKLNVSGYSGTAEDSLLGFFPSNGARFSTIDRDVDGSMYSSCATTTRRGGWWYGIHCGMASLNGIYYNEPFSKGCSGIVWYALRMSCESMKFSEMKIRLKH